MSPRQRSWLFPAPVLTWCCWAGAPIFPCSASRERGLGKQPRADTMPKKNSASLKSQYNKESISLTCPHYLSPFLLPNISWSNSSFNLFLSSSDNSVGAELLLTGAPLGVATCSSGSLYALKISITLTMIK